MKRGGCVYILTNRNKTVLYTGVTSDIIKRIHQHKTHFYKGSFSDRYNTEFLMYYKAYPYIEEAAKEEKRIKAGSRKSKEKLINSMNPDWNDLYPDLIKEF